MNKDLEKIVEIVNEIANCSSTNGKIFLLKENSNNELLKKILVYTYNDYQYGVKKTTINKMKFITTEKDKWNTDIFKMLDELANSNINSILTNEVEKLLCYYHFDVRDLLIKILLKDLKIGMNKKNINKAIPNLIPEFGVQLAESYDKHKKVVEGKEFIITTKLDGSRLLVINRKNETLFYTRKGKKVEGLIELNKDFSNLPTGVYDGELIAEGDFENSADQYKETMKRSRVKGVKKGLKMMCYDFIENEEDFWKGKCEIRCVDRKEKLRVLLKLFPTVHIKYLEPLYIGSDINMIEKCSAEAIANNEEGVMLNIADAPYETKRVKSLLKVKIFKTADVLVEAIHEGDGKLKGTLGRITVSFLYQGNKYTIDCGSGFTDSQRDYYYARKNELLNKVVTLKYFEVSKNQQGGYGLRFPIWLNIIRDDKCDINDTNID